MILKNKFALSLKNEIKHLKAHDLYRILPKISAKKEKYITVDNKKYLDLSSNDYLGLAHNQNFYREFFLELNNENMTSLFGLGATSSRLLTGNNIFYEFLEKKLAKMYKKETAMVFSNGYQANMGIISTIAQKGDVIFVDKLCHASIIDALKLSEAKFFRYQHLDYNHLEKLLSKHRQKYKNALIVTESLFSMDGDIADLKKLCQIKNCFQGLLYVDEAHSLGVFGKNGLGIVEQENCEKNIDIILGTFGKALGSFGAFIVTSNITKEYLVNKMRPFIFTTALPPIILHWNFFILQKLHLLTEKRKNLFYLSRWLKTELKNKGFEVIGNSQIIPIIFKENKKTLYAAEILKSKGFLAMPIRPPAVAPNTARLRLSLSANLTLADISAIPQILANGLK